MTRFNNYASHGFWDVIYGVRPPNGSPDSRFFCFAGIQQMQWGDGGVGLGNKVPIAAFYVPFLCTLWKGVSE